MKALIQGNVDRINFRRLLIIPLILLISLTAVSAQDTKRSDRDLLNQLQQRSAELYEDIKENAKAANQKQSEAKTISGQITRIKSDINQTEKKINGLEQEINNKESAIVIKQQEITAAQNQLELQQHHQDEILRTVYETGSPDILYVITNSNSISEIIEYNQYLEALEYQVESVIVQVQADKKDLEDKKTVLEQEKQQLGSLKAQKEAYKVGLADQKKQKDFLLVRTKQQQQDFEQQVAEAKKLADQVEKELAEIRKRLTQKSGPGVIKARDKGTSGIGFQWPTDYQYISTHFGGSTPFQPRGGHGGLDLVNLAGTPIYAASDGTVTAVEEMRYNGRFYAYGKYIVIGHNARWSSLYAHLQSFAVAVGDEIKRGDIVGYMGSTGWSTGPHLHFEIWDYESRVNPLNYLP